MATPIFTGKTLEQLCSNRKIRAKSVYRIARVLAVISDSKAAASFLQRNKNKRLIIIKS